MLPRRPPPLWKIINDQCPSHFVFLNLWKGAGYLWLAIPISVVGVGPICVAALCSLVALCGTSLAAWCFLMTIWLGSGLLTTTKSTTVLQLRPYNWFKTSTNQRHSQKSYLQAGWCPSCHYLISLPRCLTSQGCWSAEDLYRLLLQGQITPTSIFTKYFR